MAAIGYMNKKEVVLFNKVIPAGTKDILHWRIRADSTVEEVRVRFYKGVQKALKVNPFIEHKGGKLEDMIDYAPTSETYVTGDDDYFIFPVVIPCEYDDHLKVEVVNTSTDFDYTLMVQVVVDYYAGQGRVSGEEVR